MDTTRPLNVDREIGAQITIANITLVYAIRTISHQHQRKKQPAMKTTHKTQKLHMQH